MPMVVTTSTAMTARMRALPRELGFVYMGVSRYPPPTFNVRLPAAP